MNQSKLKTCDFCRKRKKRCHTDHGVGSCTNCIHANVECIYSFAKKRRPRTKTKVIAKNSIDQLNSRLSSLEGLILRLVTQFSGPECIDKSREFSKEVVSPDSNDSNKHPGDQIIDSIKDKKISHTEPKCCYSGYPCSIINVLSKKSLLWVQKKLDGDISAIKPFIGMPRAFFKSVSVLMGAWMDPKALELIHGYTPLQSVLPKNPEIVLQILDAFHNENFANHLVCRVDKIKHLAIVFYQQDPLKTLTQSELFLIHISIAACLINRFTINDKVTNNYYTLAKLDQNYLISLKNKCFQQSLIYYDNVKNNNEGIETIQAFLILLGYVDANFAHDDNIPHRLATDILRHSKIIKLHDLGMLKNLSQKDADERRRLWWCCEHMDSEMTYRISKTTNLFNEDFTILTDDDNYFLPTPKFPFMNGSGPTSKDVSKVVDFASLNGFQYYYGFYILMLNRIRRCVFKSLTSTLVQDSSSIYGVLEIIEDSNQKVGKLIDLMGSERPLFYNEANFEKNLSKCSLGVSGTFETPNGSYSISLQDKLFFQMLYFNHLFLTNRLPITNNENNKENPSISKSIHISLESARTILHITLLIDKLTDQTGNFSSWISSYQMSAFVGLVAHCLNFPNDLQTQTDCALLIKVSFFFSKYASCCERFENLSNPLLKNSKKIPSKTRMMDILIRLLLKALVALIKNDSGYDISVQFAGLGLSDHLNACESMYPELFSISDDLVNTAPSTTFTPNHTSKKPSLANLLNSDTANGHSSDSSISELTSDHVEGPFISANRFIENLGDEELAKIFALRLSGLPSFFFDAEPNENHALPPSNYLSGLS